MEPARGSPSRGGHLARDDDGGPRRASRAAAPHEAGDVGLPPVGTEARDALAAHHLDRPGAPLSLGEVLRLQRAVGNRRVQRLVQPVVQRTPLSEDLATAAAGRPPRAVLGLVGQARYQSGARDPAELTAMTEVLRKVLSPDDCWLAVRVLRGELGMSGGVTRAEGAPRDVPPQPVTVSYVEGRSSERALVIAGVHGSERQGIEVAQALLATIRTQQPHYSVVVVPSLFPQHADTAWGDEGKRQRGTQTNRNFPALDAPVGSYSGGQALDPAGKPLRAAPDDSGTARPILAENVMLMELIDRFAPSRIISIHGTHDTSASGVFADPHFMSPAKEKAIEWLAGFIGSLAALVGLTGPDVKTLTDAFEKADQTRTQNDIDLALATAYAVQSRATGASLAERFDKRRAKDKRTSPSVTGNKLYAGAGKENATWREDLDPATGRPKRWQERADKKGVSLGLYGPAKGISVFTVEPPVNRTLDYYDKHAEPSGAKVSKADREGEITAYAEAVALVLLGPDSGAAALAAQRPSPTP